MRYDDFRRSDDVEDVALLEPELAQPMQGVEAGEAGTDDDRIVVGDLIPHSRRLDQRVWHTVFPCFQPCA